jgi:hypothetical protein
MKPYNTDAKTSVPKAGALGQPANPAALLDRLLEHLMEPIGRQTRRRAAEAIRKAGAEPSTPSRNGS